MKFQKYLQFKSSLHKIELHTISGYDETRGGKHESMNQYYGCDLN